MELCFVSILVCLGVSGCKPGHGLLQGAGGDLCVAAHQRLQDSIMDEGILILHKNKERTTQQQSHWPRMNNTLAMRQQLFVCYMQILQFFFAFLNATRSFEN